MLAHVGVCDVNKPIIEFDQRAATNASKRFLIGQFVKFFLLIGPSNASKHLIARL